MKTNFYCMLMILTVIVFLGSPKVNADQFGGSPSLSLAKGNTNTWTVQFSRSVNDQLDNCYLFIEDDGGLMISPPSYHWEIVQFGDLVIDGVFSVYAPDSVSTGEHTVTFQIAYTESGVPHTETLRGYVTVLAKERPVDPTLFYVVIALVVAAVLGVIGFLAFKKRKKQ